MTMNYLKKKLLIFLLSYIADVFIVHYSKTLSSEIVGLIGHYTSVLLRIICNIMPFTLNENGGAADGYPNI